MTPAIIFYVVVLGLTAVAIYVQVTASNLSLPIPKATTILVILLPWIAAAVNFCNRLTRNQQHDGNSSSLLIRLARSSQPVLQLIQGILTVVLTTLLSQTMTSPGGSNPSVTDCLLQGRWQEMWSLHDRRRIERIQDAFECCGFRTVKDRGSPQDTCSKLYGRSNACREPWAASLRTSSGLDFGVCLVVGLIQLYQLSKYLVSTGRWTEQRHGRAYKQLPQNDNGSSEVAGAHTRLLEDVSEEEDEECTAQLRLGDEENAGASSATPHNPQNGRQGEYGTTQNGSSPVVLPSGLGNEANAWR
ncbi:Tetraspanin family [Microdochium nivale]|nr:Tetraspanin family [Microdochium nivale]